MNVRERKKEIPSNKKRFEKGGREKEMKIIEKKQRKPPLRKKQLKRGSVLH
jgi:hypothetical protein